MNDNAPGTVLDRDPRLAIGANFPPEPTLEDELEVALRPLEDRAANLIVKVGKLPEKIVDDEGLGKAADVAKEARALFKDIDADRDAKKRPYLEAGRLVDSTYAVLKEHIEKLGKTIVARMEAYSREVLAAVRRKAEEEARKAREEEMRRAELAQHAAESNRPQHVALHEDRADEAAETAARAEAQARQSSNDLTRVRSTTGTVASAGTVWKGEIVEVAKLDLEVLRPYFGRDALQKALDGFVRVNCKGEMAAPTVAGARIFSDLKTRIR